MSSLVILAESVFLDIVWKDGQKERQTQISSNLGHIQILPVNVSLHSLTYGIPEYPLPPSE